MSLEITDKFLWDTYKYLDKTGDIFAFLFNPRLTMASLSFMQNPIFKKYKKDLNKRKFSNLIYYLKTNGYIKVKGLESNQAIMLTKKGLHKVLKASFQVEEKNKRRDGKWIMIIFDIPQAHKKARILLRSILYNLGYKMFQQSVWITPYDVSGKTEKLLQLYSLDNYVKIFLIEEM